MFSLDRSEKLEVAFALGFAAAFVLFPLVFAAAVVIGGGVVKLLELASSD